MVINEKNGKDTDQRFIITLVILFTDTIHDINPKRIHFLFFCILNLLLDQ
jgi:hypothetical protein